MKQHNLSLQDENGNDTDTHLATITPAKPEHVAIVAAATENSMDGRSPFVWVRLQNGDLILGVFPCGDTYIEVSDLAGV